MKGKMERINAAEVLRLMIKQIAGPLRNLSGAEAACYVNAVTVASSIKAGRGAGRAPNTSCAPLL